MAMADTRWAMAKRFGGREALHRAREAEMAGNSTTHLHVADDAG